MGSILLHQSCKATCHHHFLQQSVFVKIVGRSVLDISSIGKRIGRDKFSEPFKTSAFCPVKSWSPWQTLLTNAPTLGPDKRSYSKKPLLISTSSAGGALLLSSLSRQPHLALALFPLLPKRHFYSSSRAIPDLQRRKDHVCHDTGPAAFDAFFGFDAASTIPTVETTIFALAELHACMASVIHLLRQKNRRRWQRQKKSSDAFKQFFRSATTQLVSAIR